MNMESLACFLMVAEHLNITDVANRMFISPSTASRQIAHLEEEFGAKLFDRHAGAMSLTSAGSVFREHAQKMIDAYDETRIAMHQTVENGANEIRIAMLNMSFPDVIVQTFHDLCRRFPDAQISMNRSYRPSVCEDLKTGKLDLLLAFRMALPALDDTLTCVPLKNVPFMVAVSADSPLAEKEGLTAADLAGQPLFMWERERSPILYDAIIQGCTWRGKAPNVIVRPYSRDDILWPVLSGQGVSIFSAGVLRNLPDSLVARPFLDMPPVDTCFCLFYNKLNNNSLISYAVDSYVRVFREL